MYQYEYCLIIDIFKLNIHGTDPKKDYMANLSGNFKKEDYYGLVLAYYDDEDEEPDNRYINFLKGDLLTKDVN
jgi:hypothetical protein